MSLFNWFVLYSLINLCNLLITVQPCNESLCAPIVSKCQLTQSCKCDDFKTNLTCSRECFICLDHLYSDCCDCVEICPSSKSESPLSSKSHVEDLNESSPELFRALTETKDELLRWISYTFPVEYSFKKNQQINASEPFLGDISVNPEEILDQGNSQINCTVAYMSQCISWNKCKSSCRSMGSASYRWFHDGCCQCIGPYCINYGLNESKCLRCPLFQSDESTDMKIT